MQGERDSNISPEQLPPIQQFYGLLHDLGLRDGETITVEHLNPLVSGIKTSDGAMSLDVYYAGLALVGKSYISPETHQRNLEYLESFGPAIPLISADMEPKSPNRFSRFVGSLLRK